MNYEHLAYLCLGAALVVAGFLMDKMRTQKS